MKHLLFISFLFFALIVFSFTAYTQINLSDSLKIESLKKVLQTQKEDTNKVKTYAGLLWEYQWNAPDSALAYSFAALELARKLNFVNGEIQILHSTGEALASRGNFSQALAMQLKTLELAKKTDNPNEILSTYIWIANVYFYSKDYLTL